MTEAEWKTVRHFSQGDNWGDAAIMSSSLILELDRFRDWLQTPIIVCCGTNGEHLDGSQHPTGRAVDIVFPGVPPEGLFDKFIAAMRFGFRGIGIYNAWEYDGTIIGGLHLDWRVDPRRALWIGISDQGKQKYAVLDTENLRRYHFI